MFKEAATRENYTFILRNTDHHWHHWCVDDVVIRFILVRWGGSIQNSDAPSCCQGFKVESHLPPPRQQQTIPDMKTSLWTTPPSSPNSFILSGRYHQFCRGLHKYHSAAHRQRNQGAESADSILSNRRQQSSSVELRWRWTALGSCKSMSRTRHSNHISGPL